MSPVHPLFSISGVTTLIQAPSSISRSAASRISLVSQRPTSLLLPMVCCLHGLLVAPLSRMIQGHLSVQIQTLSCGPFGFPRSGPACLCSLILYIFHSTHRAPASLAFLLFFQVIPNLGPLPICPLCLERNIIHHFFAWLMFFNLQVLTQEAFIEHTRVAPLCVSPRVLPLLPSSQLELFLFLSHSP